MDHITAPLRAEELSFAPCNDNLHLSGMTFSTSNRVMIGIDQRIKTIQGFRDLDTLLRKLAYGLQIRTTIWTSFAPVANMKRQLANINIMKNKNDFEFKMSITH